MRRDMYRDLEVILSLGKFDIIHYKDLLGPPSTVDRVKSSLAAKVNGGEFPSFLGRPFEMDVLPGCILNVPTIACILEWGPSYIPIPALDAGTQYLSENSSHGWSNRH